MFIQMLNKEQQSVFLSLAYKISYADGEYASEEKAKLQTIEEQLPGITPNDVGITNLAAIFTTKQAKIAMLIELVGIAMADEAIVEGETTFLQEVTKALAIDSGELDEIISWVSRAFYLFQEAQSLMEE